MITSVPGMGRPASPDGPGSPTSPAGPFAATVPGLAPAGAVPAGPAGAATGPLVDCVPESVRAPSGRSVAGESPLTEDLADDVESTRLVAERAAAAAAQAAPDAGPSAVLRLWDGRRLTLTGTALMGRNPTPHDGEPAPTHRLTLDDPVRSVSKTHLEVGVDADGVWVRDRASTNGTVVSGVVSGEDLRVQCPPREKVRVPRGATVAFGRYWFTVS